MEKQEERREKREAGKAKGGTAVSFNDMLHFTDREATARKERKQETQYVRVLLYNAISPLLRQTVFHWSLISQPHGFLTAKPITTQSTFATKTRASRTFHPNDDCDYRQLKT